jgi:hypothetical protein
MAKERADVSRPPEPCGSARKMTSTDRLSGLSERSASRLFSVCRNVLKRLMTQINKLYSNSRSSRSSDITVMFTARADWNLVSEIPRTLATEPEHTRVWTIPRLV